MLVCFLNEVIPTLSVLSAETHDLLSYNASQLVGKKIQYLQDRNFTIGTQPAIEGLYFVISAVNS